MAIILVVLFLFACQKQPEKYENHFFAMNTLMTITAYGDNAVRASEAARDEILRIEKIFDPEDPESELYAINNFGSGIVSADMSRVFSLSMFVRDESGGVFDPAIYPLVKAWGFIDQQGRVPSEDELRAAVDKTGNETEAEYTFGAVAKGYAAQSACDLMREMGIESAILNLGGNVQTIGTKPNGDRWIIGVQDPQKPTGEYLGTIKVADAAVVTSGGYERYFEQDGVVYHHIIDPKTGYPANSGLKSVTVVAEDGAAADALSTALFVLGERGALEFLENQDGAIGIIYGLVLVADDGRVIVTSVLHEDFEESSEDYEFIYMD